MENMGLRPPVFENLRGSFNVKLYNNKKDIENIGDKNIVEFCREPKTKKEIATFLNISSLGYVTAAAISFSVFIMMLSAITSVSDLGISFIISSSRVGTAASIAASLVSISTILLGLS